MSEHGWIRINFDVPETFNDRIVRCAKWKGWTKAEFIRRAIETALDDTTPLIPVGFAPPAALDSAGDAGTEEP